jgi:multicomponent Na+:H+ antiporter subunit G
MTPHEIIALFFCVAGAAFFFAGTVGLLRFPDTLSRLHAVTKGDNLGLGLTILGLMIYSASFWVSLKLLFIWLVALLGSSSACYLIGRSVLRPPRK